MSAENALDCTEPGIVQGSGSDLLRQAQEFRVQPVEESRYWFGATLQFLHLLVNSNANTADQQVTAYPAIKLVAVDGQVAHTLEGPDIPLINRNAYKMRHHVGKSLIVIALDPDDLDLALRVGELANVGQELPVFSGKTAEIKVGEDVAQQDQAAVLGRLQNVQRLAGTAYFGPEVNVRQDDGVKDFFRHAPILVHGY